MSEFPDPAVFVAEFRSDTLGGDATTSACGITDQRASGVLVSRQAGIAAGTALIPGLPEALGLDLTGTARVGDGANLAPGTVLGELRGAAADLLAVERTLLNALQLLAGIASETRRWVDRLPPAAVLLDTRKTHPGLRPWERLAVRAGGGENHRFNLADAILIKDNHIATVGSAEEAVRRAVSANTRDLPLICEVESLAQAQAAVAAGANALLIDNEPPADWPRYWEALPDHIRLEFSGGIDYAMLATIPAPPRTIYLSSSQPVLAAPPLDIGLDFRPASP